MTADQKPHKKRQTLGNLGEALAVHHLEQHGYTILARNWHCPHGEIDIIAQIHSCVVFVEVRTRRAATTEPAFESISPAKRRRMVASAALYHSQVATHFPCWRIDMIAIAMPSSGVPIIQHVEDALDW